MSDDTNRALGRVEGQLAALIEQVAKSEESSNNGRAKLHASISDIRAGVADMQAEIKAMDSRLKDVEPIVSELSKWRERGMGVLIFLSVIAAAFGAVIAAAWEKILHAIGLK